MLSVPNRPPEVADHDPSVTVKVVLWPFAVTCQVPLANAAIVAAAGLVLPHPVSSAIAAAPIPIVP